MLLRYGYYYGKGLRVEGSGICAEFPQDGYVVNHTASP